MRKTRRASSCTSTARTSSTLTHKRAFDYARRFSGFLGYQHRVLADWYGTYMPVPFNKNSMEIAFGEEKAAPLH